MNGLHAGLDVNMKFDFKMAVESCYIQIDMIFLVQCKAYKKINYKDVNQLWLWGTGLHLSM